MRDERSYNGGAILLVLLISALAIGGVCFTLCLLETLGVRL